MVSGLIMALPGSQNLTDTMVRRRENGMTIQKLLDKTGCSIFGEETPAFMSFGSPFKDGLSWAKTLDGFVIVPCESQIFPLADGLTPVGSFGNNRLLVVNKESQFGFVDDEGQEVIPCTWAGAYPFTEGYAAVQDGSITEAENPEENGVHYDVANWLFIDKDGKPINNEYYAAVRPFCNGRAAVQNKAYLWGYLNLKGQLALKYRWSKAGDFHYNRAPVSNPDLPSDMVGFINGDGQLETEWSFENVGHFSEGAAPAYRLNEGQYYVNKYGNPIGQPGENCWRCLSNIINGFGIVSQEGNNFGYVNNNGTLVIECQWQKAMPFSEGLAWVESADWRGFINEKGRKLIDCTNIGLE